MQRFLCLSFALFLSALFTALASPLRADGLSFNVTPMITDLSAQAGTVQTGLITLRETASPDTPPLRVKVSVKDWTLLPSGEPRFLEAGTTPGSCAPWLQITPQELSVPAGQPQVVRYTLTVPPGAQGTYHAIVFFTTAPQPGIVNNRSVGVSGCIGTTLYVQVGTAVRRARITALTLTARGVTLTVQNTGSSYLRLKGSVKITDAAGALVAQMALPGGVVLPGKDNTRTFTLTCPAALPGPAAYTVTALLDYGGNALLGGRAHAQLP